MSVKEGLNKILKSVNEIGLKEKRKNITLIAVSKTKPLDLIKECYDLGQRHFGENYINELVEKSIEIKKNDEFNEIKWHYIGSIQSNKVKLLVQCKNLYMVQTLASIKIAKEFNKRWNLEEHDNEKLNVLVQVNTSFEEQKSGVLPGKDLEDLVNYVVNDCENLCFKGLMTIGISKDIECFKRLVECKETLLASKDLELQVDEDTFELSMGMSNDYAEAIEYGATYVRVGSSIFGARDYPKKKD